jgi:hypothetical protein
MGKNSRQVMGKAEIRPATGSATFVTGKSYLIRVPKTALTPLLFACAQDTRRGQKKFKKGRFFYLSLNLLFKG